ncbi:MAG: glycosyltransferase family 39 protein [Candidatus Cloacimonetes bacterium]|nr:glycosyltransferase family 39 protein [Candidatus Cloacimonadota bacterium]
MEILKNDRYRIVLLICFFIIALTIRIGFTHKQYVELGTENWKDAKLYLDTGIAFSEGNFYPPNSEEVPYIVIVPGVPLIVAASKLLFGDPVWPVLMLNCLVSALLVFVLYSLGKELINKTAGLILSFWSVFNFSLIRLNHQILKEPLLCLLVPLITLLLLYIYKNKDPLKNTLLSALSFSVLIHIDERFFVYFPIILLAIVLSKRVSNRVKYAGLWLLILIVSMVPWTIRNYRQFDELVILSPRTTSFTSKLWGTNWGSLHFENEQRRESSNESRMEGALEAALEAGVELREYGKFEKHYMAFYHYWKPVYLKTNFIQYGFRPVKWSLSHNLSGMVFYGLFLPFYLAGFILAFVKKDFLIVFISSIPFLHSLMHTVMVWPLERYRIPMNFYVILVSIWFISEIVNLKKNREITEDDPDVI